MAKSYTNIDFEKSFQKQHQELKILLDQNAHDKKSLIQLANTQRNLARLTFQKSVELKHSSEATSQLLKCDLQKYEQMVHRTGKDGENNGSTDHLLMADSLELLDKVCPDGSYKALKNTTWTFSMSAQDQIRKYDLPCRRSFLGCSEEELIDAEKNILSKDRSTERLPPCNNKVVNLNGEQKPKPNTQTAPDVFVIFKPKLKEVSLKNDEIPNNKSVEPKAGPSKSNKWAVFKNNQTDDSQRADLRFLAKPSLTKPEVEDISLLAQSAFHNTILPIKAIEPKAGPSNGNTFNKWTAFQTDQSDDIQREEVPSSQADLMFPAKPSLKRRIDNTNVVKETPPPAQSAFHTATEVLQQQLNLRNGGRSNATSDPQANSSTASLVVPTKKSLGGRRNVQSKFVPPFIQSMPPQQADETSTADVGDTEMIDERLKHIDPKMVELIRSEIMDNAATQVTWADIAGLEYAKATIKEAVVWPLLRPDIFTGLRRPPRGILLFGPPGTGKTLIGKCIASQSKSTFFSISASSLTSKWIGDGEKMVRALFAVASVHQPAVVFIDEIDSLLCQRSENEHESSRRLKTEFLIQLDGAATGDDERILIVGATNRPQELDEAARRRLVKRLYIPLPELSARQQILRNLLQNERTNITSQQIDELGRLSSGFSGADMKTLCHEASMGPIRSIDMDQMEHIDLRDVRPVCYADFESALRRVRSSVSPNDLEQYLVWDRTYGSGADEK